MTNPPGPAWWETNMQQPPPPAAPPPVQQVFYHAPPPPPPMFHRAPPGGAAITAALLALGGGVLAAVGAVAGAVTLDQMDSIGLRSDPDAAVTAIVSGSVLSVLLILGSLLMFARRATGRAMVVLGSTLVLLASVGGILYALSVGGGEMVMWPLIVAGLHALFPFATLLCAASGSTTRWLRYRRY